MRNCCHPGLCNSTSQLPFFLLEKQVRGRRAGGSGWGIHVYPWLIHVYVWQKPLQYCKVISLQLIKKKKRKKRKSLSYILQTWLWFALVWLFWTAILYSSQINSFFFFSCKVTVYLCACVCVYFKVNKLNHGCELAYSLAHSRTELIFF